MSVNQRLDKLEKRIEDAPDWTEHLPEGVTVAQAEAVLEVNARLAAAYATQHGVTLETAVERTLGAAIEIVQGGGGLDDDDDE